MGRSPCCDENGLKKGPWTPEEDEKLIKYIKRHGHGSWRALPKEAGLNRCGKSCRLRWTNYLRPDIKRGKFSPEEEQTILSLHSIIGNKWSAIATHLPGRTDNEIKNFWNTHLKKKLLAMGIDPVTHQPRTDHFLACGLPQLLALASLKGLVEGVGQQQLPPLFGGGTDGSELEQQQQAEVIQAARIQYLQCLLQSAAAINAATSSTVVSAAITDACYNNSNKDIGCADDDLAIDGKTGILDHGCMMSNPAVINNSTPSPPIDSINAMINGISQTHFTTSSTAEPLHHHPDSYIANSHAGGHHSDISDSVSFQAMFNQLIQQQQRQGSEENGAYSWSSDHDQVPALTSPATSPSSPLNLPLPQISVERTLVENTGEVTPGSLPPATPATFWPDVLLDDAFILHDDFTCEY